MLFTRLISKSLVPTTDNNNLCVFKSWFDIRLVISKGLTATSDNNNLEVESVAQITMTIISHTGNICCAQHTQRTFQLSQITRLLSVLLSTNLHCPLGISSWFFLKEETALVYMLYCFLPKFISPCLVHVITYPTIKRTVYRQ